METLILNTVKSDFDDDIDFVTFDVSFISLSLLLKPLSNIIRDKGEVAALIKPQFESTKEIADKYKGVINDKKVHKEVLENIINRFKDFNFIFKT